jgi:hypothetical protein
MNMNAAGTQIMEIMLEFARLTGLEPVGESPRRYLWTDAFAVCNFLELFHRTGKESWRELALRLVDQVHHCLGRHRADDSRTGWISGLDEREGESHPTMGGLRIGKELNERGAVEPYDERLEWERDGQYYHYLTKWMHALNRVSGGTGDTAFLKWALELARTSHAAFTHAPVSGGRKKMYWKMSIDLSRPLVPSMGLHDPLDGLATYGELQASADWVPGGVSLPDLHAEIAEMTDMCRGMNWATDDPLGIGGLLCDAARIARLTARGGGFKYADILESVVDAALSGLESFAEGGGLGLPVRYRLAFRELGLSIGLKGAERLRDCIEENPDIFGRNRSLHGQIEAIMAYRLLGEKIDQFWLDDANRKSEGWVEHREINMVMLATSLAPGEFLMM